MIDYIEEFKDYLRLEKKSSDNTMESYLRDVKQMLIYFEKEIGIKDIALVNDDYVCEFILNLTNIGKSASTIKRMTSSLKCYFSYLEQSLIVKINTKFECSSKIEKKKLPEVLNGEEIIKLLDQPDCSTIKGCRDKAILEILYATGMKVSEIIAINVTDIDLKSALLVCKGSGRERVIPLYNTVVVALDNYINLYIGEVEKDEVGVPFFVNMNAKRLTRQGVWKIIKFYAQQADIDKDITPQTLRHSFATHLMENGAKLKDVQKVLGHSDISSTQVYLQLANNSFSDICLSCHPRARQ